MRRSGRIHHRIRVKKSRLIAPDRVNSTFRGGKRRLDVNRGRFGSVGG